jgi:hypothetical protein
MKVSQLALVLPATAALLVSGCDRGAQQAEAQRLAEERAALERDKAALASDKAAAQQAAIDADRARLDADRADLNREKDRLDAQRTAQLQSGQARLAAERRADQEAAARREAEARERQAREDAQAAEPARGAQNVSYFYDTLDPYGDWVDIEPYGYAFRPNAARSGDWRPYTDGDWIYTDYGWTWRSDEPFGWATYHYGRWARVPRMGWVWVPGTEWAPAWVSWRHGSDYVGWAPLPPDASSSSGFNASVDVSFNIGPGMYTFLHMADFGEPTYVGRVVEPSQNVSIINQTTNITNVTYKTVQNRTTIVNEGPALAAINQRARQPVRQMRVERLEGAAPQAAKVQGNTLQMVAPNLKKPVAGAPVKPRQVRETVKAAEIDRGWAGAKAEEPKIRAEAARQAREAEQAERVAPRPVPTVKPVPAIPPAPFQPGKGKVTPPAAVVEESVPNAPARPAPSNPSVPANPPVPSKASDAAPGAAPAAPGKPDKHDKHKGPELPPRTEPAPREVAPPIPPAPAESRPQGHGKHPDASPNVPWNHPEPFEAPGKKAPQARPGATPAPDAQVEPDDSDGKHKKHKKD